MLEKIAFACTECHEKSKTLLGGVNKPFREKVFKLLEQERDFISFKLEEGLLAPDEFQKQEDFLGYLGSLCLFCDHEIPAIAQELRDVFLKNMKNYSREKSSLSIIKMDK